jgi:hypothetical protein
MLNEAKQREQEEAMDRERATAEREREAAERKAREELQRAAAVNMPTPLEVAASIAKIKAELEAKMQAKNSSALPVNPNNLNNSVKPAPRGPPPLPPTTRAPPPLPPAAAKAVTAKSVPLVGSVGGRPPPPIPKELDAEAFLQLHADAAQLGLAAGNDEEVDPLDAFMQSNTSNVRKEFERSKQKIVRKEVLKAEGKWVEEGRHPDEEADLRMDQEERQYMNKQCFMCKQVGHTQEACPNLVCHECKEVGHKQSECPIYTLKLKEKSKEIRRERNKKLKKERRKEEWEAELRTKAGVDGFQALYICLGLPVNKLASKADITKRFRELAMKYHPDKVHLLPEDEQEDAAQKFMSIKAAYDLLLEGIETGGKGMKGAVYSAGELTQ